MKKSYLLLFCLFPLFLYAQVINTERLRLNSEEQGWNGSINASYSLSKTTIKINSLNLRSGIEYVKESSKLLIVGRLSLSRKDDTVHIANDGFFHTRYGMDINPVIHFETFGQIQFHEFKDIGLRSLMGMGPRFKIVDNDSVKCFLGALYMYEYEELFDKEDPDQQDEFYKRDHRLSAYVSFAYRFTDFFFLDFITYYQPKYNIPADYRISLESILNIELTRRLSFGIIFNYGYDSRPPDGIPRINYSLNNTLGFSF